MDQVEVSCPEEQLKPKLKHKHTHRSRKRSSSKGQKQKECITLEYSGGIHYDARCTESSYKQQADLGTDAVTESNKEERRRKKKGVQGQLEENTPKNDQNQNDYGNNFPESFPEGRTKDIIEFLQKKMYILDTQSCSENIKVPYASRPDTAVRQISKKTTDAIRGAIGVQDGVHTFEISFNDKPWGSHCAVGVCSSNVQLYSEGYGLLVGNSPEGWVWEIASHTLYHNGENIGMYPGPSALEMPHAFRMIIDREQGQLAFNIGLGNNVVFKDLPDSSVVLYPVVSMVYGMAKVTIKIISSDLFKKYVWLPQTVSRTRKHKSKLQNDLITDEKQEIDDESKCDSTEQQTDIKEKPGSNNRWTMEIKDIETDEEKNDDCREAENKSREIDYPDKNIKEDDLDGFCGDANKEAVDKETVILMDGLSDSLLLLKDVVNIEKDENENDKENVPEDKEEETDFDQESMRVESLDEDDQFMVHVFHGWDNTCKGSLIQPYPNAPHICVPLPNLVSRIQGVRCRHGFSGRGIHTWLVKELIVYTSCVAPEHMAYYRNNVIIGVATNEQRKFNFGYNIGDIGNEIWGLQYPELMVHHGNRVYRPELGPKNPNQINLEKYDLELTDGIEMILNTVTHRLTFVHKGTVLTELHDVKGEKLYPFIMYVKDAYYPLELNYVEGPKEYFDKMLQDLQSDDKQEVYHVKMIMKRSSSMREVSDNILVKDKYIWGCHSPEIEMPSRNTVCNAGIAVATFPLGGSRHKVKFYIEGSTRGFCIGFVHHGYPLQPVIQDTLPYLGNDLLSWCWDIDNKCLLHACKTISRYPVDEGFDQDKVISYTMTLDFSHLGHNTASFTAHLQGKNQPDQELGIAFISLPAKVLPTVVMKGNTQRLRMEYVSGPWKGVSDSSVQTVDNKSEPRVKSEICIIL